MNKWLKTKQYNHVRCPKAFVIKGNIYLKTGEKMPFCISQEPNANSL